MNTEIFTHYPRLNYLTEDRMDSKENEQAYAKGCPADEEGPDAAH